MHIHLDTSNGVPLYLQIVQQVTYLVASGRLAAGEELPPIRALAERLLINPNTVARAYRELERTGVVEKRSTTGTFVAPASRAAPRAECLAALAGRVDALVAEAAQLGVGPDELAALVRQRCQALEQTRKEHGV